jgi:hypothetical protein
LTIELTLAQELIPTSNLDKRYETRFKSPKLYSFQSPPCVVHVRPEVAPKERSRLPCRTYPKDTQLNNLMRPGIRIRSQGVAQPCNLFTQSISLSNIQVADFRRRPPWGG